MKKSTIALMCTLGLATPFSVATAGPSIAGMINSAQGQAVAELARERQQAASERQQEARADQQERATNTRQTSTNINKLIHQ